jgi:hypothetical protein
MGKGGGGSAPAPAPTSSTVTQTNLPEYVEPFFTRLLERTEAESNAPYIPYGEQRLAEFGPDTLAGFQDIRDIAGSPAPAEFGTASGALTYVAGQAPLEQQAQFGDIRSFTDPGVSGQYINPYIQNVLDVQKARLNERFGEQRLEREAQAVGQGAFTNVRRDVQEQIAQRELNRQQNELEAQGLAQAYESGANIFNLERSAGLQNRALNTEVFAGNLQRAIEQDRSRISASEQLRAQGLAGDEVGFGRAKTLAGVGGAFDLQTQQGLDIGYGDFINQRDFPRQQLNYYSGILRGVPVRPQQEITTYQAPPSQLSQLLGLGVGGLGLAKAFG